MNVVAQRSTQSSWVQASKAVSSAERRAGVDATSTSPVTATTVRWPASRRSRVMDGLGVTKLDKGCS